jgi:hypothetical protein
MPKQILKIDQFHGGLNSNSDPRDIAETELSEATDVMVDELGKIRLMGGTSASSMPAARVNKINPGYGLFQFSHDRVGAGKSGVATVDDLTRPGSHTAWQASQTHTDVSQTSSDGNGGGIKCNISTDGSGYTTFVIVTAGYNYAIDEEITFTDPGSTPNTAVLIVASLGLGEGVVETGDDYLAFSDPHSDEGQVDIYSNGDTAWGDSITGMTNNSSGLRADVFYTVDGALRVCDSDFGNSNTNQWYGYVDRVNFTDSGTASAGEDIYNNWVSTGQAIASPTRGFEGMNGGISTNASPSTTILTDSGQFANVTAAMIDGQEYLAVNLTDSTSATILSRDDDNTLTTEALSSGHWTSGETYFVFPKAGTGFHTVCYTSGSTGNGWGAKTYQLSSTFIYDDGQESLPFVMEGTFTTTSGQYPEVRISLQAPFPARISGGRLYCREQNSTDKWTLLMDIDFDKGIRPYIDQSLYLEWETLDEISFAGLYYTGTDKNNLFYRTAAVISKDTVNSYDLGGIDDNEKSITSKYKTAVVANRITYIGNIEVQYLDGTKEVMGDAMIKSPVNKFDTFPLSRIIEASVRDGDEIVKLEEYADRILQFKKNKMHLINISQDIEFLEDTFMYKGVSHPAATCKTDFGIAWVNKYGCYLYDGQNVVNLLEKDGRQIISEDDWGKWTTEKSIIGYIPQKRQLMVIKDSDGGTDGDDTYHHDMVTQSWVKLDTDQAVGDYTNLANDWDGLLIMAEESNRRFCYWQDPPGDPSSGVDIKTKDIDFGQPAQRKKIYKVYVSYRGDGSNAIAKWAKNGDNDTYTAFASNSFSNVGTDDWVIKELAIATPSDANNVYSFQVQITDNGYDIGAGFEINDISIVYRLKGIK